MIRVEESGGVLRLLLLSWCARFALPLREKKGKKSECFCLRDASGGRRVRHVPLLSWPSEEGKKATMTGERRKKGTVVKESELTLDRASQGETERPVPIVNVEGGRKNPGLFNTLRGGEALLLSFRNEQGTK